MAESLYTINQLSKLLDRNTSVLGNWVIKGWLKAAGRRKNVRLYRLCDARACDDTRKRQAPFVPPNPTTASPLALAPTFTDPGTESRIRVLQQRAAAGLPLNHPRDETLRCRASQMSLPDPVFKCHQRDG